MKKQKKQTNTQPQLMNEDEASDYTGLSLSFFRKSRCHGLLKHGTPPPPFKRIGGRIKYYRPELDAWIAAMPSRTVIG